jgi:hypothetical protein
MVAQSNDLAAEVLCELTFLLTLPFDAGVPDGNILHLWSSRADASVAGWSHAALLDVTGADAIPSGAAGPWLRLEFRRGVSLTRPAPDVGDRVFDDRVSDALHARQRLRRRLGHLTRFRGGRRVHSVVATTRYFGMGETSETGGGEATFGARAMQELISDSLEVVLRPLAQYLSYIALAGGQPGRRALSAADLPAGGIPTLLRLHRPGSLVAGHNAVFCPQLELPALEPSDLRQEDIQAAQSAFLEAMSGNPFASYYELIREANALHSAGQYAWAVTSAATAIELLCRLTLRHAASELGQDGRLPQYDRASFYSVLSQHLPDMLGLAADAAGPPGVLGRWHRGGYMARNRFVHEGTTPSRAESAEGLSDAEAVSEEIHAAVRGHPRLSRLKEMMFIDAHAVDVRGGIIRVP